MGPLDKLETSLDDVLNKNAPVKIPPEGRKSLAHALWWIALAVGVIQLWLAITFWQWGHATDRLVDVVNYYTGGVYVRHLGLFYYVTLAAMAAAGVLLLVAAPQLKAMRKSGWNLLYYGALVEAVASVGKIFAEGAGFFDFVMSAIGVVIGAYLLFQVREYFVAKKTAHSSAPSGSGEHHKA